MKKKVFFMALAAIVAFASCDNDVESESRCLSGYFTIVGDAKQGYTLYQDGGGIIKPSFLGKKRQIKYCSASIIAVQQ